MTEAITKIYWECPETKSMAHINTFGFTNVIKHTYMTRTIIFRKGSSTHHLYLYFFGNNKVRIALGSALIDKFWSLVRQPDTPFEEFKIEKNIKCSYDSVKGVEGEDTAFFRFENYHEPTKEYILGVELTYRTMRRILLGLRKHNEVVEAFKLENSIGLIDETKPFTKVTAHL